MNKGRLREHGKKTTYASLMSKESDNTACHFLLRNGIVFLISLFFSKGTEALSLCMLKRERDGETSVLVCVHLYMAITRLFVEIIFCIIYLLNTVCICSHVCCGNAE